MSDVGIMARYSPTCAKCKDQPAVFRVSVPPITDHDGNEVKPLIEVDPIDLCLGCLGFDVERLNG